MVQTQPVQYLLDTNVLSETRRKTPDENVIAFVTNTNPAAMYLSVLTLGELRKGIAQKQRTDPAAAAALAAWADGLEYGFADRILGIDQPPHACGANSPPSARARSLTPCWPQPPSFTSSPSSPATPAMWTTST